MLRQLSSRFPIASLLNIFKQGSAKVAVWPAISNLIKPPQAVALRSLGPSLAVLSLKLSFVVRERMEDSRRQRCSVLPPNLSGCVLGLSLAKASLVLSSHLCLRALFKFPAVLESQSGSTHMTAVGLSKPLLEAAVACWGFAVGTPRWVLNLLTADWAVGIVLFSASLRWSSASNFTVVLCRLDH